MSHWGEAQISNKLLFGTGLLFTMETPVSRLTHRRCHREKRVLSHRDLGQWIGFSEVASIMYILCIY